MTIPSSTRRICILSLAILLTTACASTTEPDDEAPTLPPETSMAISFDDFMAASPDPHLASGSSVAGANWTRSAVIVVSWNAILGTVLVTPVTAFVAAASQTGEPQEDGSWAWVYDFSVAGVTHSARLEGRFVPQGVQWDMFITKTGEYSNFHWFTGVADLLGTSGQWNLNLNPDDPTPFMQIDWSRNVSNNTGEIRYTNVIPMGDENGAYIQYGLTSGSFDAFYEIFSASSDNMTSIEWSRTSKLGRVQDELFYNDQEWHCWDVSLEDTACS